MINYDEQRYQAAIKKVENFIELALNANGEAVKHILMSTILTGGRGMNVSLGGGEHNIYVVMDAIYDYARKHPEVNLPDFIDLTIKNNFISDSIYNKQKIARMFSLYDYILKCQKEKTATFHLDVTKYLEITRDKFITEEYEFVKKEPGYEDWIKERNEFLEQNYHYHL